MGLTVNTNIAALNAYRNLSNTQTSLNSSLEKLSSGYRINRAADDAAGLAISQGLQAQIGGLTQAARNAQDGINVVQTAEGALTEVHSVLQRLNDLAVQASNDSNNSDARSDIADEATQLVSELTRIGKSTNFNGTSLLDGGAGTLNFQVGADGSANSNIAVDLSGLNVVDLASTLSVGAGSGTTFALTDAGAAAVGGAQAFKSTDSNGVATSDSVTLGAAGTYSSVQGVVDGLNADSGFSSKFAATVVKNAAGTATGFTVESKTGGTVASAAPGTGLAAGSAATGTHLDFSSHDAAQSSITLIGNAIQEISTQRASLGAYENRFSHTINSVNVAIENLTASNSQVQDTDMASEMVNFTRAQILQQAGTAMLAQANSAPQSILKLLQ
ncbi:MAG TPA: flagellin [Cellulomonas sp.]